MSTVLLEFRPVEDGKSDRVAVLTLNRPDVSNAFNGQMIEEILRHFDTVRSNKDCRLLCVRANGKHFSGGADLEWMRQSSKLGYDENVAEAGRLSRLFSELYEFPIPTMAVVHGASFGGAVGLVACCDFAVAVDSARFCLSEVKVGLVAAVILPYLSVRVHPGDLKRFVLTARVFGADEALRSGLVQRVVMEPDLPAALREEVGAVLQGEPNIQRVFKQNHRRLLDGQEAFWRESEKIGIETIAAARISATGQAGLDAFLNKRAPDWVRKLPPDWSLA